MLFQHHLGYRRNICMGIRSWKFILPLLLLSGLALLLRGLAVWQLRADLQTDPDAYWSLAKQLAAGRGYSFPGLNAPTAYRPPLYPLLLWGILVAEGGGLALGIVQALLGTATVGLTWQLGRQLHSPAAGWLAAGLVTVDPLLLRNTALPMTETLSALLTTLWLVVWWHSRNRSRPGRWRLELLTGILFGLCVLCRPTQWAFVGLWGVFLAVQVLRRREWLPAGWYMVGTLLVVLPWLGRNLLTLHQPVFTTTHGGYTLLLGNNPVFYREEVCQPWGTVWDGGSLNRWQQQQERERLADGVDTRDEAAVDNWCYQRAREHIRAEPGLFLRACLLRIGRFWNIAPAGEQAIPSRTLYLGIAAFYTLEALALLLGIGTVFRQRRGEFLPLLVMLLSFTAVHTVYWSNMRMRAPLIPVIAVLAAVGILSLRGSRQSTPGIPVA